MAVKRKFSIECDSDAGPNNAKQLKLIPFPHYEPDTDVAMSDAEPMSIDIPDQWDQHQTRLPSDASSLSDSSDESPVYPTFDLYPLPFFDERGSVNPNSHTYSHYALRASPAPKYPPVGLLQPTSSFVHHGTNCSQIPKLRVACSPGTNGERTMWSFCEQCGAISMVESD